MEKTYDPKAIEQRWYQFWEERGYFAPSGRGESYCIMIPPPNVTGTLHMGHAFQDTIMDVLIRYHRMRGYNALWQAGTDHAGIATQMVVERQLAGERKTRHELGREAFIQRIWRWKEQSGGAITRQLRRMGASLDWSRERFTMDPGLSEAVQEVFIRLYEEGLLYRGKRLVNWDPALRTAVSDLEVISDEENGFLWRIRYPLAEGGGDLVVATTRPETMLGDTAVAVHPNDERYRNLIGLHVILPLAERRIPIIADEHVDPQFGTGCLKITPGHDFNDYAVGQRHQLPLINIFTSDARLNDQAPARYRGMDRYEARKQIVADLEERGLLESAQPHKSMIPRGDRSGAVIEPFLTDQWYVRAAPLAGPAIAAVKTGRIRFVPDNWEKTYYEWLNHIEDWCISRQIWWGHRIPAWYAEDGTVYVGCNEAAIRARFGLSPEQPLRQDEDVLDTWFSSALWPFSTLGWPQRTSELATFYPTSVLVTGFDIIFFWVARMIMMGLKFMDGQVPFKTVYIHGLVRDADGQKMSKSKGNVLDPIDITDGITLEDLVVKRTTGLMQPQFAPKIEKATRRQFPDGIRAYGVDALRFTFAALATTGRDIVFDLGRVEGYRNFCNKLWNAARYVELNAAAQDPDRNGAAELNLADRWILSRLQHAIGDVNTAIQQYRFDHAAQAIYEFIWNEYCDWYLELSKPVLLDAGSAEAVRRGVRRTLTHVLETALRLTHPFMPFITEEIWRRVAPLAGVTGDTIMLQPFPLPDPERLDPAAEAEIGWLQQFLLGLRRIRAEMDIPPGKPLPVLLQHGDASDRRRAAANEAALISLGRLASLAWLEDADTPPEAAIALVGELKLLIPLADLIDKEAEIARLNRDTERLRKELERGKTKLDNADFLGRAPPPVVARERARVMELQAALDKLAEQLQRMQRLSVR